MFDYREVEKGRKARRREIVNLYSRKREPETETMAARGGGASASRTRVGRYELGRTLGEGTFAKVKFAKNVETGEHVAIKILDKEKVLKHKMIAQVSIY